MPGKTRQTKVMSVTETDEKVGVGGWTQMHRETYYKDTLLYIYERLGTTCDDFPQCEHKWCSDSHEAWARAELSLFTVGELRHDDDKTYDDKQSQFGLSDGVHSRTTKISGGGREAGAL